MKKVLITVLALSLSVGAFANDLEDALSDMLGTNAELYLEPMTNAFGANMNSGWYHRSKVHKMLGFDISLKAMGAMIPEDQTSFMWYLGDNSLSIPLDGLGLGNVPDLDLDFATLYAGSDLETATVFGGDGGSLTVNENTTTSAIMEHLESSGVDTSLVPGLRANVMSQLGSMGAEDIMLPGGIVDLTDLPFPLAMPQLAVGLPMGIEVVARGIPAMELPDNLGEFSAMGGGLRLNLDQFIPIPLFPVDITAGAFYQGVSFTADDQEILKTTNMNAGLQVGKSVNLLVFGFGIYGDVAYEMSTIDIAYTAEVGGIEQSVEFSTETDPGLRYGLGLHIKPIPFVHVSAHAAQTPTNLVATLGVSISVR